MATDNWPADYIYVSRRLAREIIDQDTAARRTKRLNKVTAGIPGTGMSAEFAAREVDLDNPFELARRATEAVVDLTGSLQSPGPYVRATLDCTWDAIPVHMGWDDDVNVKVAGFFADVKVVDLGGVFFGLFGSASNFLGRVPTEYRGEWMPSDALGLYRILDHTSEPEDPTVEAELVDDDLRLGAEDIVRQTVTLFEHARPLYGRGTVEVLAKCYVTEPDIDLSWNGNVLKNGDNGRYGLAILGAPIWVATPEPYSDPYLAGPRALR